MRALTTVVLLVWSPWSIACDCATTPLAERVKLSDNVYLGEVVKHAPLASVDLKVLENFKGKLDGTVTVITGRSTCDYFLRPAEARPGERFLVFMSTSAVGNTVNRCFGSAPETAAATELKSLREGIRHWAK